MHQELPTINGELLRLRREERGWALSDLATRACMSIKQIRQLEEGGSSSFYSETVKWTSAKKVGSLLGMAPDEVFVQTITEAVPPAASEPANDAVVANASEVTTELALTPETVLQTESKAEQADTPAVTDDVQASPQASKTPVLALAALFVAALAVAAWMRPEPEVVSEPAPPVLQNMVTEASDAASSTSATTPTVTANGAASAASQAQKPASSTQATTAAPATAAASGASSSAVAVTTSASAARPATPASSAAPMANVKPANAVQAPASAASPGSKPL